ncbi:hypothetical protein BDB00DRAFT_540988 [Zychaea mexicana]|uniref:uncharacterized protein n=1 Tax=Zychaea mexicana TaxID=64656 RepID=UPI0022FF3644|nr:uncharacterized protein BDB00DRAFT_540988 [Zychaea mexicana]KAI9497810.1 hypothetical protein BDB00DRAFT_540988 [Zychaea mexicana]
MPSEKTSQTTEDDFLPRMAPLSVPWKRRLQTAAVLFWGIEPALFFCIFLFLAAIPVFWPLAIAYVIWLWMDQAPIRGGRRRELARTWSYWRYFADYFPAIITKEADLDPSRNYLFG